MKCEPSLSYSVKLYLKKQTWPEKASSVISHLSKVSETEGASPAVQASVSCLSVGQACFLSTRSCDDEHAADVSVVTMIPINGLWRLSG